MMRCCCLYWLLYCCVLAVATPLLSDVRCALCPSPSRFVLPSPLSLSLSHTTTFPGGMLLQNVVLQVVVQEREVVIKGDRTATSPRGLLLVQLFVVCQIVQNLVVVGLGIRAGTAAVSEYQFLPSLVTQSKVCYVEVDLAEQAPSAYHRRPLLLPATLSRTAALPTLASPLLPTAPLAPPIRA